MSKYRFSIIDCEGKTPTEAFEKFVKNGVLVRTDCAHSTVRADLMHGSRRSFGFYKIVHKDSSQAPLKRSSQPKIQSASKTVQFVAVCPSCGGSKWASVPLDDSFKCLSCGDLSLPEEMPLVDSKDVQ